MCLEHEYLSARVYYTKSYSPVDSGMGQLFGKPKPKSRITDEDRALASLKIERDKLDRAYKRHEAAIERHKEMARELLRKDMKDRALLLLKRKKFDESMMERIDKHLTQIRTMIGDVETAQMNRDVLATLQEGNQALIAFNRSYSIDDIEKIMEDTREAADYQAEIASILSGQLTEGEIDDVEKEFDELVHFELPDVPQEEIEAVKAASKLPARKEKTRVAVAAN